MRPHEYPKTREEIEENGWEEVTEERYNDLLGCVPPARMNGGAFAVGEALCQLDGDYSDKNKTVYNCLVHVDGRYFSKPNTLDRFNPPRFRNEVREQYKM